MKFENTEVFNFKGAIRGMRNPLESWDKSDTKWRLDWDYENDKPYSGPYINHNGGAVQVIGPNDLSLMQRLIRAGTEHRKFLRQIIINVDITAPMYWWAEFDTYKVGTVANSTSKMHKLASTPITTDCFEMDDFENIDWKDTKYSNITNVNASVWKVLIKNLEGLRQKYNETKDKRYWKELIRLLPESWLQTRTVTMNYENVLSMIHQRKSHKLTEWSKSFIEWAHTLPYAEELLFLEK